MKKQKWKILGVDHVTIAVKDIDFWRRIYTEYLGGKVVCGGNVPDTYPEGPSSMSLCGLRSRNFRVALVSGIDRKEKSQVTKFIERHGDHSFQHVAVMVSDLVAFVEDARKHGFKFLGPILERKDLFGHVRQVFAKRFDALSTDPAEGMFYEFVERPKGKTFSGKIPKEFSEKFAKKLYRQIERARKKNDLESFVERRKK